MSKTALKVEKCLVRPGDPPRREASQQNPGLPDGAGIDGFQSPAGSVATVRRKRLVVGLGSGFEKGGDDFRLPSRAKSRHQLFLRVFRSWQDNPSDPVEDCVALVVVGCGCCGTIVAVVVAVAATAESGQLCDCSHRCSTCEVITSPHGMF